MTSEVNELMCSGLAGREDMSVDERQVICQVDGLVEVLRSDVARPCVATDFVDTSTSTTS